MSTKLNRKHLFEALSEKDKELLYKDLLKYTIELYDEKVQDGEFQLPGDVEDFTYEAIEEISYIPYDIWDIFVDKYKQYDKYTAEFEEGILESNYSELCKDFMEKLEKITQTVGDYYEDIVGKLNRK